MIRELLANYPLMCGFCTWTFCQTLKMIFTGIRTHQWSFRYFWPSGGMPSSHSASVAALTVSVGLRDGFSSSLFAISMIFACVVMYDAMGVRRETGKQGKIINEILRSHEAETEEPVDVNLKERTGHSPLEVAVGVVIGICFALIFHLFMK